MIADPTLYILIHMGSLHHTDPTEALRIHDSKITSVFEELAPEKTFQTMHNSYCHANAIRLLVAQVG